MGSGKGDGGLVDMDTMDCSTRSVRMTSRVSRILPIWTTRVSRASGLSCVGAGQYRDSQIQKAFEEIKNHPFGNTHSNSPASKHSEIKTEVGLLICFPLGSTQNHSRVVPYRQ